MIVAKVVGLNVVFLSITKELLGGMSFNVGFEYLNVIDIDVFKNVSKLQNFKPQFELQPVII